MTPAQLSLTVRHAMCRAVESGALTGVSVPDRVRVERPRAGGSGDWATGAALPLARPAGRTPREVAGILRDHIGLPDGVTAVEITGPGFLNFTLAGDGGAALVRTVLAAGIRYGHGDALAGTAVSFAPATELRAEVWTGTVVALLRSQGATAAVAPGGTETPHVVPAPCGDDLLARLGTDAARWGLLRPAAHDRPLTGASLLVQRESNPLFRVRYAYARARALARNARELGITPETHETHEASETLGAHEAPETLEIRETYETREAHEVTATPSAPVLLAALGDHPAVLESAARLRAPDRLARHLEQTADAFLRFQESGALLPLGDEKPMAAHRSRLALAAAAGTVLAGGLSLLGVDAPEHL
ncbi:arginyl-tRNA synthetase [Streptomyces sp. 150FB]|uniref:ArgS-related anticodon-binding protein NrtL n=1 Tax=Streptomyces sp. 150FB TaxID=1576605 RepID=UPI000588F4C6|nr:DALR anticodon-binding domain-containing protein [Streptomyces sp. 150FB]KIF76715.1 arginyl-tRNA synthetase [Streptomyces sp. 150FB]